MAWNLTAWNGPFYWNCKRFMEYMVETLEWKKDWHWLVIKKTAWTALRCGNKNTDICQGPTCALTCRVLIKYPDPQIFIINNQTVQDLCGTHLIHSLSVDVYILQVCTDTRIFRLIFTLLIHSLMGIQDQSWARSYIPAFPSLFSPLKSSSTLSH